MLYYIYILQLQYNKIFHYNIYINVRTSEAVYYI